MKEKFLILCYRAPYPLKSGSEIRMYQFIEILSQYYDTDVLYLKETEEGDLAALCEKCCRVEGFAVKKPIRLLQSAVSYMIKGEPLQAGYFYSAAMQQWINDHISEYQNILCMHIRTAGFLFRLKKEQLEGKNLYLDGIDAISFNYYNAYKNSSGLKRFIYKLEYKRMRKYEKKAYEWFGHTVLISERDREYIRQEIGAASNPAVVYNYAIDFGYMPQTEKKPYTIAFMGKMNYAPNVEAVLHFTKHVFGSLKEAYPALEFLIIGGFATNEIQKLEEIPGIHVLGFVDNPAILLQEATLIIAPMISGSGLQNKIVQAMYLGCTVVTTEIGADGLAGVTDHELIISKDTKELLNNLLYYLKPEQKDARRLIGERARAYISQNYSFEAVEKQMEEVFGFTRI